MHETKTKLFNLPFSNPIHSKEPLQNYKIRSDKIRHHIWLSMALNQLRHISMPTNIAIYSIASSAYNHLVLKMKQIKKLFL